MIWKRLKKPSREKEQEFQDMMSGEEVTWKDKLAMVFSAYLVILVPCIVILLAFGLLILWAFGAL